MTTRRIKPRSGPKPDLKATKVALPDIDTNDLDRVGVWLKHTIDLALEAYHEMKGGQKGIVYVFVANFATDAIPEAAQAVGDIGEKIRANGDLLIARGCIPEFSDISFDA